MFRILGGGCCACAPPLTPSVSETVGRSLRVSMGKPGARLKAIYIGIVVPKKGIPKEMDHVDFQVQNVWGQPCHYLFGSFLDRRILLLSSILRLRTLSGFAKAWHSLAGAWKAAGSAVHRWVDQRVAGSEVRVSSS